MARPKDPTAGSLERMNAYVNSQPKIIQMEPAYVKIYQLALKNGHWIYDPDLKRWYDPEEFKGLEQKINGGDPKRLQRMQVRDPMQGIKAAHVQLQDLKDRMEIFIKRVVEYYRKS